MKIEALSAVIAQAIQGQSDLPRRRGQVNGQVVPTQEPGVVFIPGKGYIRLVEWREGRIYDRVTLRPP